MGVKHSKSGSGSSGKHLYSSTHHDSRDQVSSSSSLCCSSTDTPTTSNHHSTHSPSTVTALANVNTDDKVKILLLGTGEGGKATIFKQMVHQYGTKRKRDRMHEHEEDNFLNSYQSLEVRRSFIPIIHRNCILAMYHLIQGALFIFHLPIDMTPNSPTRNAIDAIGLERDHAISFEDWSLSSHIGTMIQYLWYHCEQIQEAYRRRNELELEYMDSAQYWFSEIDRLVHVDYVPKIDDIMRMRVKTTGIVETELFLPIRVRRKNRKKGYRRNSNGSENVGEMMTMTIDTVGVGVGVNNQNNNNSPMSQNYGWLSGSGGTPSPSSSPSAIMNNYLTSHHSHNHNLYQNHAQSHGSGSGHGSGHGGNHQVGGSTSLPVSLSSHLHLPSTSPSTSPSSSSTSQISYLFSGTSPRNGNGGNGGSGGAGSAALLKRHSHSSMMMMNATSNLFDNGNGNGNGSGNGENDANGGNGGNQSLVRFETNDDLLYVKSTLVLVGSQRNERKKWIYAFDNVTAIVFVVALSEYNQLLYEDGRTNRMQESLLLFPEIANSRRFENVPIILVFNKIDVFMERIQSFDLTCAFPQLPDHLKLRNQVWSDFVPQIIQEKIDIAFDHISEETRSKRKLVDELRDYEDQRGPIMSDDELDEKDRKSQTKKRSKLRRSLVSKFIKGRRSRAPPQQQQQQASQQPALVVQMIEEASKASESTMCTPLEHVNPFNLCDLTEAIACDEPHHLQNSYDGDHHLVESDVNSVNGSNNLFSTMAFDVILYIFMFLEARDLAGINLVCLDWYKISESDILWRTFCLRYQANLQEEVVMKVYQRYLEEERAKKNETHAEVTPKNNHGQVLRSNSLTIMLPNQRSAETQCRLLEKGAYKYYYQFGELFVSRSIAYIAEQFMKQTNRKDIRTEVTCAIDVVGFRPIMERIIAGILRSNKPK